MLLSIAHFIATLAVILVALFAWIQVDVLFFEPTRSVPPAEYAGVTTRNGEVPVFVYGTLEYSVIRLFVYGSSESGTPADLPGFRSKGLTLVADKDHSADGHIVWVTGQELARIDRYEDTGSDYTRIVVTLADNTHAWTYVRIPATHPID